MDIEELVQEIAKTKEQLDKLQQALEDKEDKKYKKWTPIVNEKFYYVDYVAEVGTHFFDPDNDYDKNRVKTFNCFRTEAEAEAEAEKILVRRMLEDIARRLNKSQKLDWTGYQRKYFIELCYGEELSIDKCTICKKQGTIYCLDEKFLDIAIQEIGEERLKRYLRGE